VKTLAQRVSPYSVIFYTAGTPHGMYNPGPRAANILFLNFMCETCVN
jgi:hypothetical protein